MRLLSEDTVKMARELSFASERRKRVAMRAAAWKMVKVPRSCRGRWRDWFSDDRRFLMLDGCNNHLQLPVDTE